MLDNRWPNSERIDTKFLGRLIILLRFPHLRTLCQNIDDASWGQGYWSSFFSLDSRVFPFFVANLSRIFTAFLLARPMAYGLGPNQQTRSIHVLELLFQFPSSSDLNQVPLDTRSAFRVPVEQHCETSGRSASVLHLYPSHLCLLSYSISLHASLNISWSESCKIPIYISKFRRWTRLRW